jgi:hypothetical protein
MPVWRYVPDDLGGWDLSSGGSDSSSRSTKTTIVASRRKGKQRRRKRKLALNGEAHRKPQVAAVLMGLRGSHDDRGGFKVSLPYRPRQGLAGMAGSSRAFDSVTFAL